MRDVPKIDLRGLLVFPAAESIQVQKMLHAESASRIQRMAQKTKGEIMSSYDEQRVAEILAGEGTWFTAYLFRLIAKADKSNRANERNSP